MTELPRDFMERWLAKYAATLTNVRHWVSHGQSEHAVREIEKVQNEWSNDYSNLAEKNR